MCALALSGRVNVSLQLTATNAQDLTTPSDPLSIIKSRTITSGTGSDQADLLWHDERTLTNGATESLDLHGGTLSNSWGAVTFDKVKGIAVFNYSMTDGIKIGGVASGIGLFNATTDILILPAASATNKPSLFLIEAPAAAGINVVTNDEIKVAHGGTTTNTITYDIVVWGED
jgi:hypothetical protein